MAPKSRPKRREYTEEQKQAALAYYEQHGTSAASKHFDIPKGTINSWARRAGVRTVRNENAHAAREARRLDLDALRKTEAVETMQTGIELRKRILNDDHGPREWRDTATAVGILYDKADQLASHADDGGISATETMLGKLAAQLGVPGWE
jgi:transposase-like protein